MKVLNLYAGIGGNRKLWTDVEVTAIEINSDIATIYQDFFPDDIVIVGDAHQYLLEHYEEFDFIWSSPPCPTHSDMRRLAVNTGQSKAVYPDMALYQEILLLTHYFKGLWVIENVVPFYEYLIKPSVILGRHPFWSNFLIAKRKFKQLMAIKNKASYTAHKRQEILNVDISNYSAKGIDKRKILNNCVDPLIGQYILNQAQQSPTPSTPSMQLSLMS